MSIKSYPIRHVPCGLRQGQTVWFSRVVLIVMHVEEMSFNTFLFLILQGLRSPRIYIYIYKLPEVLKLPDIFCFDWLYCFVLLYLIS